MNSHEYPGRVDLSALDPEGDPATFDATVQSIAGEAMAMRARSRAAAQGALASLVAWSRPMLAAAVVVLIVSGSAIALLPGRSASAPASLVEAAGVPAPLVDLATSNRALTANELVDAFDVMAASTPRR